VPQKAFAVLAKAASVSWKPKLVFMLFFGVCANQGKRLNAEKDDIEVRGLTVGN